MSSCSLARNVLPTLVVAALAGAAVPEAEGGEKSQFHWVNDQEQDAADLLFGDQPVLRYMYAFDTSTSERAHDTYKVFHHVFGPGTGERITKGPGGKYSHHRGLFVGWRKTQFDGKSLDFWHCPNGIHLKHVDFVEMDGEAKKGWMVSVIHWNEPNGKTVISETRRVAVSKTATDTGSGYGWQIDWRTKLETERDKVKLDGDHAHAGFQFRAHNRVAETNGARYIRPEGFPQQPQATNPSDHVNLGWLAMTYELDGTRYTIAYMEDPLLPRPARFSERPYGRFGSFFRATVTPEKPLRMRYRVIVFAGESPSQKQLQKRYDAFVKELESGDGASR